MDIAHQTAWGKSYLGYNQSLGYYPDMYANYWSYVFDSRENPDVGFRIAGAVPDCRFFNYTLYDDDSMNFLVSLLDREIQSEAGRFTLFVLPEGADLPAGLSGENILRFGRDVRKVNVLLRYYAPAGGDTGGVPLPSLEAFDLQSGAAVDLPTRQPTQLDRMPSRKIRKFRDVPVMAFLRSVTNAFYPNPISEYLYGTNRLGPGEVAVFSFRPPTHPENSREPDVRYWSVNLGDNDNSHTFTGMLDADTSPDAEGFVGFVVADPGSTRFPEVKEKVEATAGLHLLPWNRREQGDGFIALYRGTLFRPDYEHSFQKTTIYNPFDEKGELLDPPPFPSQDQIASAAMGEYGPLGKKMSEQDFLDQPQKAALFRT